jgi:hypothetical protein
MTAAMTDDLVARRRAVEALRSGVPSWDAVAALGSGQPVAVNLSSATGWPAGPAPSRPGCCSAADSARARATC